MLGHDFSMHGEEHLRISHDVGESGGAFEEGLTIQALKPVSVGEMDLVAVNATDLSMTTVSRIKV